MKNALTLSFVVVALSACSSSAALVRRDAVGGRIALQGAYMPAMADARMLMTEHCDGRYQMVELRGAIEFHCGQSVQKGEASAVARNDSGEE